MSSANKPIKAALRRTLVPRLIADGYEGRFPHFRRREGDALHLLSVQFDKWGGGFFLEFTPHPAGDLTTSWGEVVPEAKLTVSYAPVGDRARLQEVKADSSIEQMWFRFDGLNHTECERLANHVVDLLPQINAWLRERKVGPNVSAFEL